MPKYPEVETGVYADDRVYFTASWDNKEIVPRLNNQLNLTHEWCKKWRIKNNANKCVAILFGNKLKNRKIASLKYNDIPIEWKDEVNYLGVILDKKLSFSSHTDKIRNKALISVAKLYPLLKNHSSLGIKNGLLIYKMLIRPVLTYAPAVWGGTFKSNIQKLQLIQNRVLKMITNAPVYNN